MTYVDGFVIPIAKKNVAAYTRIARKAGKVWKKYGAIDYKECVGDDLEPSMQGMESLPFPRLTNLGPDEALIFSFIVFESRQHRDEVNAKVMADPAMSPEKMSEMPFEMTRFSYGGFNVLVDVNSP